MNVGFPSFVSDLLTSLLPQKPGNACWHCMSHLRGPPAATPPVTVPVPVPVPAPLGKTADPATKRTYLTYSNGGGYNHLISRVDSVLNSSKRDTIIVHISQAAEQTNIFCFIAPQVQVHQQGPASNCLLSANYLNVHTPARPCRRPWQPSSHNTRFTRKGKHLIDPSIPACCHYCYCCCYCCY